MNQTQSSCFRSFLKLFALLSFSTVATTNAVAEVPSNKFEIPRSAGHTVKSDTLERTYQIYVRTPRDYDKDDNKTKRYPVIYLNDAPYTFQVASGVTHIPSFEGEYEGVVLVGISYALGEKPKASRTRDLTPTVSEQWKIVSGYESGGAPAYLKFLEDRLMPFVERKYRVDANRRTLAGHSFGGLFAAWVMLTKPALFENYIISSPSLWFDHKKMFDIEEIYAAEHGDLKATVYFGTGQLEQMYDDLTADHIAFVEQLRSRKYPSLMLRSRILEDIDHTTAFPINFTRASRWIFHSLRQ